MKYFIDTEFIEGFHKSNKRLRHHVDLISIGIFCEDGRELHLISNEYEYRDANDWVKQNVILPLYIQTVHGDSRNEWNTRTFHKMYGYGLDSIRTAMIKFFEVDQASPIQCYGYYSDYDWVAFCSIFGTMMDLPDGFPMYCIDLKQMLDEKAAEGIFPQPHPPKNLEDSISMFKEQKEYPEQENEHNALADAKWNFELYKFLSNNTKQTKP